MRWIVVFIVLLNAWTPVHGSELGAVRRLLKDPAPSARAAAVRRLTGDDSRPALQVIVDALGDEHPYVRRAAAAVLGQVLEPASRRRARSRIRKHRNALLRAAACDAYALWFDTEAREALRDAQKDKDAQVRVAALRALWRWTLDAQDDTGAVVSPAPSTQDVAVVARALLDDADGFVRANAVDVLRQLPGVPLPAPRWIEFARDTDARVRLAALEGSVAIGGEPAVVAVLHGLNDAVWSVRLTAAELAGAVRDRRVLEALPRSLRDKRQVVRDAAHGALIALSGIPFDPKPSHWYAWLEGDGKDFDPASREPNKARRLAPGTDTVVKVLGVPLASGHVAFVLDASGSMARATPDGRTRWVAVCEELNQALGTLMSHTHVAVHCFSTDVRTLPSAELSRATRRRIAQFLESQEPGGRTALYDGMAAALSDETVDTVVVLSDGAPSAGTWFTKTDLLQGLREANRFRKAKIHVVAVGVDGIAKRWRDVLKRVAAENRGTYVAR